MVSFAPMISWNLNFVTLTLLLYCLSAYANDPQRGITIHNDSSSSVHVLWVHPQTKQTVSMASDLLVPGAQFPLNSFVGHEFRLDEVSEACQTQKNCRSVSFVVAEEQQQNVRLTEAFELSMIKSSTIAKAKADTLVKDCKNQALHSTVDNSEADVFEALVECVEGGIAETLEAAQSDIAFQATVRTDIAHMLENYTCLDSSLESSADLRTDQWIHMPGEPTLTVHVKHDRPASRIHLIEDFIRPDECQAMEKAASATLHRATVADGKGGSRISENRKAMQAGITVPWEQEEDDHPIARLSRRVYDYTNHVLGLNIEHYGQEDLMSIQYFGRGQNDTEPDRYTPHCDGECTGQPHKTGTRVATLVMYCDVATVGGHTNFRNSGVHVKPIENAGIFFSYIDPNTRYMDTGYTEHSGCPVFEGHKKIVTQWVRLGVDTENPWNSFNTLGIKKSDIIDD